VSGKASGERGLMHANQIIERYQAPVADFRHRVILITINRTVAERESVYAAVRYAWKLDPKKARKVELVLAVKQGLIVGVFVPTNWMEATTQNFPGTAADRQGRWGFDGAEASYELKKQYERHRVPEEMRKRGAANPIKYFGI
jgi:uncharacterized protein